MKYVFNKGRYGVAFEITVKGRNREVKFDRRRVYMDTGNIATTGITEVEDDIYDLLLANSRFKELIDSGELTLTSAPKVEMSGAEFSALQNENEKLKKELEEAKKNKSKTADNKGADKQLKAKDDEIKSLKAQIEALTKKDKSDKETDGF